jgi:hypothetical protein
MPADPVRLQWGLVPLVSTRGFGEQVSINPFDDDNGSFFVWSTTRSNTACGRPSPTFHPAGGWFTAKRPALRVCTTSNRIGAIDGQRLYERSWHRAGLLIREAFGGRSDGN